MTPAEVLALAPTGAAATLIYDGQAVKRRMALLVATGRQLGLSFSLAVKACDEPIVLAAAAQLGLGFDVSNRRELEAVLSAREGASAPPGHLTATGPMAHTAVDGPCPAELVVFVESSTQFSRVAAAGVRVGIRLQPTLDGPRSRFGTTDNGLFRAAQAHPAFAGLHVHIEDDLPGEAHMRRLVRCLKNACDGMNQPSAILNLGGGLGRVPTDRLLPTLQHIRAGLPVSAQPVLEPGSFWFNGSGFAVGRVVDVCWEGPRQLRVVTTLSRDAHLRWSHPTLFGLEAPKEDVDEAYVVRVVGPTCYEGDVIGVFAIRGLPPFSRGTSLLLSGIEPYSAMWNTSFNGVGPTEVVWHGF